MAKTRKRGIQNLCFRQPLLKRRGNEIFIRRIGATGRSLGIREMQIFVYGKQVQLFSDHQALEPLLKRNKANKQNSALLIRWLDRRCHLDISLKHSAGKGIEYTDFISSNPTEKPEPAENYGKEIVVNAIAQLATVNARIGRTFNQSETENTVSETNMHDTRTLLDRLRCQTSKSQINSNYYKLQPLLRNTTVTI